MFQIVYSSQQTAPFSLAQLSALLTRAREANRQLGITGMLLHQGGRFLQVLEGEEEAVRALVEKIIADPRHAETVFLHEATVERREFPDWSMGFRNLDVTEGAAAGFSPFLESSLSMAHFASDPPMAKKLLLAFKSGAVDDAVVSSAA